MRPRCASRGRRGGSVGIERLLRQAAAGWIASWRPLSAPRSVLLDAGRLMRRSISSFGSRFARSFAGFCFVRVRGPAGAGVLWVSGVGTSRCVLVDPHPRDARCRSVDGTWVQGVSGAGTLGARRSGCCSVRVVVSSGVPWARCVRWVRCSAPACAGRVCRSESCSSVSGWRVAVLPDALASAFGSCSRRSGRAL